MSERQDVQVAFPIPVPGVFTYSVPEHLREGVSLGSHVVASLGRRKLSGFVVSFHSREDLKQVKPLENVVRPDPVFDQGMLDLAYRVTDHYLCPLGEILAAAYPAHAERRPRPAGRSRRGAALGVPKEGASPVQCDSIGLPLDYRPEAELLGYLASITNAGSTKAGEVFLLRLPREVRERIYPWLVNAITQQGGSVLFLVPEISPSALLVKTLKSHFGNAIDLFHARLKISDRKRIWEECRAGDLKSVIGTRSAVFLPLRNLRLMVIEDEHAQPFKQEETPRYNGRDVALMRGRLAGVPVVLASSTPSVETYLACKLGTYRRVNGTAQRTTGPEILVVDMRDPQNWGPDSRELSASLVSAMRATLATGKKVLLFLNRRGFSSYIQCQDCGSVEICPRCELPLVYHSDDGNLLCHHCGHKVDAPSSCGKCAGVRFRFGATGVEKIQSELSRLIPSAKTGRIDFDSSGTKPSVSQVATDFAEGKIDILVGTSMITKGLDLGDVSLVGVLHAEARLNIPDFRSGERAFELLSEIAGLANVPDGRVIIQTLNPEHHSISALSSGDAELFYEQELKQRMELGYPPFSTLIRIQFSGPKESQVLKVAGQVGSSVTAVMERMPDAERESLQILGPSPAFPPRLKGRLRWHMTIRGASRETVMAVARGMLAEAGWKHEIAGVTVSVDVDPVAV